MACCDSCGIEAPTKYVEFYQNIGALVMRFTKSVKGNLCKNCIGKHFWPLTLTTFFIGWFGLISLIITPFILLNNIFRYLFSLGLEAPPPGAKTPRLTDEVIEKLSPHTEEIFKQAGAQVPLEQLSQNIAKRAGVTPGEVSLYIQALVAAAKKQQQ